MPKFIPKTVTLPDDVLAYAEKKIERQSKETGEPANLSKYVRDLIREDKERDKKKAA